jgi:hypothetical protein
MAITVDALHARQGRQAVAVKGFTQVTREEDNYYATMYMGAPPATAADSMKPADDDRSLPQAYLVEQPPNATVPPHFHDTHQFQVFIHGEADFGKKAVKPLSVHYAGGHTPYGPIVTRDEGVHYFTLRAQWDSGGKPMPQSRELLQRGRQCHRLAEDIGAKPATNARDDVMPVEADGLGATMFSLAPGERSTVDLAAAGGGQYALVVEGSAEIEDASLGKHSCVYRYAEEPALDVQAGDDGLSLLLLQFPVAS